MCMASGKLGACFAERIDRIDDSDGLGSSSHTNRAMNRVFKCGNSPTPGAIRLTPLGSPPPIR